MTSVINNAFMKLSKRAEMNDRAKLVETFVDVGPLFTLLSSKDHQILYGRRGTGKTHALSYLAETMQKRGDSVIYIDLRTVGSTTGIFSDESVSLIQRATRLLVDTLGAIHDGLFEYFVDRSDEFDLSRIGPRLDALSEAITEVIVIGSIQKEKSETSATDAGHSIAASLSAGLGEGKAGIEGSITRKHQEQRSQKISESGTSQHRVHFGAVNKCLVDITKDFLSRRIWLLLDEWSSVPLDIQPYLADLLRRSIFPVTNFTTKIAAIEQRAQFRKSTEIGDYIGLELGADIAADLNLDDFMVFDNDAQRSKKFFQELLFKHFRATEGLDGASGPQNSSDLIHQGFTQKNAFDEFVRATEGVPRDAINILTLAAQKALEDRISINLIRTAARNWYQRDKEAALRAQENAHVLLHWIIDEVIGNRRARAFLLRNDVSHELIDALFDARVLHVLKKNISARDQPGVRYDAYKLDFGCYVELINTTRAPQSMLPGFAIEDDESAIEVPSDDYRAIRRAILDIGEFSAKHRTEV